MVDARSPEELGARIGRFRVIEELGQGGMGTVFVGEDDRLERRVALKVIRPDQRLDPLRKARFLREARVLSALDHPHVCQFHDYIEGDNRDCLVLELVEGRSLREVMEDGLEPEVGLDIAEQLLDVLVAVHGQGVIHRDLKPENIMITDNGIKVLDFGLARPVEDPESLSGEFAALRERTLGEAGAGPAMTTAGTVLGTIGYMSPEVARGEPATAASDIYATGLILHELLTGRRAIPDDLPVAECHRRAMWSELEPLSGLSSELADLISRLESLVPGNRPSAIDAAEMLRVIRDRPRRRRRRRVVAAVWALLALFGVGMTVQYLRAEKLTRRAEEEAATAREVSRFLMGLFEEASPELSKGEAMTVETLLQRGADSLGDELRGQPAIRARMLHTLGTVQYQLGRYDEAAPLLEEALALRRELPPTGGGELADTLRVLGLVRLAEGRYDEAERILDEGLAIAEVDPGADSTLMARLLISRSGVDQQRSNLDDAESRLAHAVAILEAAPNGVSEGLTDAIFELATLNRKLRRLPVAERYLRRCLELDTADSGMVSGQVAGDLTELCAIATLQGRHDEAERLARQSLDIRRKIYGSSHPHVAHSLTSLGFALSALGRYDEASSALTQALGIYRETLGDDHPFVGDVLHSLGRVAELQGDLDEASRLYLESLRVTEATRGPDHRLVADTVNSLADVRSEQGRCAEAEGLYARALAVRTASLDADDPRIADTLEGYAECLKRDGRSGEAAELEKRARTIRSSGSANDS